MAQLCLSWRLLLLLQHGTSAFLPYINHLVGQPAQGRSSAHSDAVGPSSGGGSNASSNITLSGKPFSASGILGCLSSQDWAVRRAAADAVRAVVLLVGPELEPEDCWGLGDPGSVTGRCLNALEDCRFDKVGVRAAVWGWMPHGQCAVQCWHAGCSQYLANTQPLSVP